jgi:hypothetical protein
VIDSLNMLPAKGQGKYYTQLVQNIRGPFLLVVILDTANGDARDLFWEFAADSVMRLSQVERNDPRVGSYLLGEFRIAKARWQKHALGSHQVKVFGKVDPNSVHSMPSGRNYHATGHLPPFRKDGGIQLYQSLHRHLSEGQQIKDKAKKLPLTKDGEKETGTIPFDPSSLAELDKEIGGFPRGRCTALVGARGSLKSHLAYLWLLSAASRTHCNDSTQVDPGPALLISLRDDEGEALSRLHDIHKTQEKTHQLVSPDKLIHDCKLRVVHFRPGYIAPDEFLFRLWFHV